MAYLCTRARDPFDFIQESKQVSLSKPFHLKEVSKKTIHALIGLLKSLLSIQKGKLTLTILNTERENGLPRFKLSNNAHEVILYFGGLTK